MDPSASPTPDHPVPLVPIGVVPVEHRRSPKGTYEIYRQHVSLALGGVKDAGAWNGGHPFDVERFVLPPGKKITLCTPTPRKPNTTSSWKEPAPSTPVRARPG